MCTPNESSGMDNPKSESEVFADTEITKDDMPEEESSEIPEMAESDEAPKEEKRTRRKARKIFLKILMIIGIVLLLAVVAIAGTVFFMSLNGKKTLKKEPVKLVLPTDSQIETSPEDDDVSVEYDGDKYVYNKDIITFVVMGVDRREIDEDLGAGANGQADVVFLVIADTGDGSVDMVSISRDALVDVNKYTTAGKPSGIEKMQLCLAYAYGDGQEKSCENVAQSVSRLFYGIPISGYVAIDLDAISVLTDAVDGVTVPEYTEDGSQQTGGTITLDGETAEKYLRRRDVTKLDSNTTRMQRQSYYLDAFISKAVSKTKQDITTPLNVYNALDGYMVTDITASEVVYLATEYIGGVENMSRYSVKGTVSEGEDGYAEFIVDTAAMDELVLELFYEKK